MPHSENERTRGTERDTEGTAWLNPELPFSPQSQGETTSIKMGRAAEPIPNYARPTRVYLDRALREHRGLARPPSPSRFAPAYRYFSSACTPG